MRGVLLQVSLFSVLLTTTAAAQATDDFATLADRYKGSRIVVRLDSGESANGRLLRSTLDTLTLGVPQDELVYQRRNVEVIYKRGTAIKKGMLIGVLSGAALGLVALSTGGDDYTQAGAAFLVPFGFLVGTGVGAVIPTKRVIFNAGHASW
jgi:hypothetical protein